MKDLVYYSVGGQNVYATMLMYSIKSLDRSNPKGYDVVINTSKQYADFNFAAYDRPNTYFNYMEPSDTGDDTCFNKLRIFEYPNIGKYDRIIYFDVDVLINYDLSLLFDQCTDDVLYAPVEDYNIDNHRRLHFGFENYTEEDIDRFREKEIYTFNAGTFMFRNSFRMQCNFKHILEFIKETLAKGNPYFADQSFLNYYFNTTNLIDTRAVLKVDPNFRTNEKQIYQYVIDENFHTISEYNDKIFHLIGSTYDGGAKIYKFMEFYNKIVSS